MTIMAVSGGSSPDRDRRITKQDESYSIPLTFGQWTLWTSIWYAAQLNWLGRALMDVLGDETYLDFDRMQMQLRTRDADHVYCRVVTRYGWGKFKVFSTHYKYIQWQERARIKYRYKVTHWYTPWYYGWFITYRTSYCRYYQSGHYWTW
jgi:hypothetical protein